MANEIVTSGIGDLTTTEIVTGLWLQSLADRNALPNHPALLKVPSPAGRGSTTIKVPQIGLMGYDLMATATEGSSTANSALVDASTTLAIAPKMKVYEASDLARLIDALGVLNPQVMAMDALISASVTLRDMVANLCDTFTTTVGTSGVNASVANWLDVIATLEIAKVQGPYLGILHPRQWADIREDAALNSGGAIVWNAGAQGILDAMKGLGYQGNFLGVDVFTTTSIPTVNAGADRGGGVFGRGAIVWTDAPPPVDPDLPQLLVGDRVLFEKDRTARAQLTAYVMSYYVGAAEAIDLAGVTLATDA
jgi:hypothetical protein